MLIQSLPDWRCGLLYNELSLPSIGLTILPECCQRSALQTYYVTLNSHRPALAFSIYSISYKHKEKRSALMKKAGTYCAANTNYSDFLIFSFGESKQRMFYNEQANNKDKISTSLIHLQASVNFLRTYILKASSSWIFTVRFLFYK